MQSNRSYAIYGDGSTGTATILPSLNSVANQSNTIQISKNTNLFKTWQNLILQDDIIENFSRFEYPYTANIDASNYFTTNWKFELPGFVDMSKIGFQFNMNVNITNAASTGTPNQVATISTWAQGQYQFMEVFKRLLIRIGKNTFVLGKEELITTLGLKLQAILKKKTPTNRANLAQWGSAYSISRVPNGLNNRWYSSLDPYANYYNLSYGGSNGATDKAYSILFSDLIPFFDQPNVFLPKGLELDIQLELQTPTYSIAGGNVDTVPGNTCNLTIPTGGFNPFIYYNYHILQEDTQRVFNSKWVGQSLLYNYIKWDIFTTNCVNNQTFYVTNIKINQQRPLDLIIFPTITTSTPTTGTGGFPDFPNSAVTNIKINLLRIYIQGRLISEQKNDIPYSTLYSGQSIFNTVQNIVNSENMHEQQSDIMEDFNSGAMIWTGNYFKVSINPGYFFKRGILSMDEGAINMRVEIDITAANGATPPSTNYKIVYFTRRNAQVSIDSNFNVLEVEWPAVISDNSIFLQKTINSN